MADFKRTLDLVGEGLFDAIPVAGMSWSSWHLGTEALVLQRFAAHLAPEGFVVTGFHTDRELTLAAFDAAIEVSGLQDRASLRDGDLRAWQPAADFVVTVPRHTQGA